MSIRSKLLLMAAVAAIALMSIFGVSTSSLVKIDNLFLDIAERRIAIIDAARTARFGALSVARDAREYVLVESSADRQNLETRIGATRKLVVENFEILEKLIITSAGKKDLEAAVEKRNRFVQLNNRVLALAGSGDLAAASSLITSSEGMQVWNDFEAALDTIVSRQSTGTASAISATKSLISSSLFIMIFIGIVAFVILIALSVFTIRAISNGVAQISRAVEQVTSSMRFSARIPRSKDELNRISLGLNKMFEDLERSFQDANNVVSAIAKGNFTQRITNNYVGDLDSLKQGINGSADNTTAVMKSLRDAMENLQKGQFSFQVDTNAPGDYGVMLENVAQTMRSLSLVVADINRIMNLLNDGDFSARVNAEAQGDLLTMSNIINQTMDTLDFLINDLVRMAQAQMEGDLTVVSSASYKGRFDELQKSRAESTDRIKNVVSLALDSAEVVFSAANQVSRDSDNLSNRVQQQAAAIEETSATMQEMTSAVQANTENAQRVADLTHEVERKASEGLGVMQETIDAIRTIQESSNQIADIINIIDSIAFQTNLLALNAAVEAARAGEHGRGFAVVAGEVRTLAGRSADAARDIKTLIENSVERVEAGTKLADKSGESLESISTSVSEVALMIESISAASEQQSEAISQVNAAVIDIDKITQENAALVEETSASAQSLYNEATSLQSNMSFFNTGRPAKLGQETKTQQPALLTVADEQEF